MKKRIIAAIVASSISLGAFADVTAQSGFYVGGNLGWSSPSTWSDNSVAQAYWANSASTQVNGFSAGASVGYDFAMSPNFLLGAELGYMYLGSTSYNLSGGLSDGNNVSSSESAVQLLLTATYLNPNGFNIFAKVGAADLMQANLSSVNIPYFNNSMPVYVSGADAVVPAAAIGIGYLTDKGLDFTLQYEQFFGGTGENVQNNLMPNNNTPQAVGVVTLGVSYHFGQ